MSSSQLWNEMLELSGRISQLDFTLEEHLLELRQAQGRQIEIRALLEEQGNGGQQQLSEELRAVIDEVIRMERANLDRMKRYKSELEQIGSSIQSAKRVRNVYEGRHIQNYGYFIDFNK